ncbi:MAG: DUF1344 domain-containing protein [Pseudomonadota bacterium]
MKNLSAAAVVTLAMCSAVFAGESQGVIETIDQSTYTITLSDGENYKLPEEFDISLIGPGMRIALAFDEQGDEKLVTDMEQID